MKAVIQYTVKQQNAQRISGWHTTKLSIFYILLLNAASFFTVPKLAAQNFSSELSQDLLSALQRSKSDTNRISLLLKLASFYLNKSNKVRDDLDTADRYIKEATNLSKHLQNLDWETKTELITGSYCAAAGDLECCRQHFMKAISYYNHSGNDRESANAFAQLGDLYENNGKYDHIGEMVDCYNRARTLYTGIKDSLNAAHTLAKLGNIAIYKEDFDLAEKQLLQSLEEYKHVGYKRLQIVYERLGAVAYLKNNYYRAMTYAANGIKAAEATADMKSAAGLYEEIGRYNFIVKNYKEALQWLQKAMAVDTNKLIYKCQIVSVLLALERVDEAKKALDYASLRIGVEPTEIKAIFYRAAARYYTKINKPAQALQYYSKIFDPNFIKSFNSSELNYWLVLCDNDIAAIYIKTGHPEKAKKYLDGAGMILQNTKRPDLRYVSDFYVNSYKYDVATGNYKSAVKHLEESVRLQDSLFTINRDNKFAELVIQFETTQKEQSIKNLHNQAAVQQAKLKTANLQRNITITGILLMIIISALVFKNYKQKQKANKIITGKNNLLQHLLSEKEWLLKEVHHRVKNNLHTVMGLLESQAMYLENDALEANEKSKHRIYAMSLIHQQLYKTEDIKSINMSVFLPELLDYLKESFGEAKAIQYKRSISPIKLEIAQAIPVALIVNEAVTNAIKYAFCDGKSGTISINMYQEGSNIILSISDNGVGINPAILQRETSSMGLKLMRGLVGEMDGKITIKNDKGTVITIIFCPDIVHEYSDPSLHSTVFLQQKDGEVN
jgi:two-component sensor histidine kinase